MSSSSETLDYYEKLILYYLSKTNQIPNQTEISRKTGINYRTITSKIPKLEKLEYIQTHLKGKNKIVSISKMGRKFLDEWVTTELGEKTLHEFNDLLEKNK